MPNGGTDCLLHHANRGALTALCCVQKGEPTWPGWSKESLVDWWPFVKLAVPSDCCMSSLCCLPHVLLYLLIVETVDTIPSCFEFRSSLWSGLSTIQHDPSNKTPAKPRMPPPPPPTPTPHPFFCTNLHHRLHRTICYLILTTA